MIRYGPAGIPLSCKGRTLKDGIEDVHNLALTALEIQMIRPRYDLVPPENEDIGKCVNELGPESEFIIGVKREEEFIYDPETYINEEDNLIRLSAGPAACLKDLPRLGNIAKRHDISLSLHTPYYMDLTADPKDEDDPSANLAADCLETIKQAGIILDTLKGDIVVTNLGSYSKNKGRNVSDENIMNNIVYVVDWWHDMNLKSRLGIEITGNQDVWGSMDQVFDLCDEIDGLTPVLNFPHFQSRTKGSLVTATDFADLLAKFNPYSNGSIYSSFSNVEYDAESGNERWLTPIKKGDLKFERLAEVLAEMKPNMTIISSSPLLEHDAVYMRTLTERVLSKKAAKFLKEKRKAEEAATKADGKELEEE